MQVQSKYRGNQPEFLRVKGADQTLAFDDDLHRYGLDPAGAEAAGDLLPQQRTYLIADDTVQDASCLLGHYLVHIELSGIGKGLLDGVFGNGVEDHAVGILLGYAERLSQMPGNRLALAVKVSCQIQLVDVPGSGL